jgi:hypothetical protein
MGTLRPNTVRIVSAIRKSMLTDRSWPNPARCRPHEIAERRKYGKGITINTGLTKNSFHIAVAPVVNLSALVRIAGIRASLLPRLS